MHARGGESKAEIAPATTPTTAPPERSRDRAGPAAYTARLQAGIGNQAVVQRKCACAGRGPCPACEERSRARKAEGDAAPARIPREVEALAGRGGGERLPPGARAFFERAFGADLGGVRVHSGGPAAAAESVAASAYTIGNDIVFGAGKYQPDATEGRRLIAHELAHVVQQASGAAMRRGEPLEREADRVADEVIAGAAVAPIALAGGAMVQRQAAHAGMPDAGVRAPAADAGVAPCPVAAITDADALAMENGTRVIWNHTAAGLQAAATSLIGLITTAGGTAHVTSAYRPQAYQDHLREIWDKARALQTHPEPACNAVRTAVDAEMANHRLNVNRPVATISNHLAGNAVDIEWTLPATLTAAVCQLPVPDGGSPAPPTEEQCIDSLAGRAGLSHPLHALDVPHFEV